MSAYRAAVDETTRVIDLRARYFRNLIVTVVSIGAIVLLTAFVTRARALWGWLLFVPTCATFFYVDARVLNRWRTATLAAWVPQRIDLDVLRKTLQANPTIPKGTLEGMLATLPHPGDLAAEQRLTPPTRRAIAAISTASHEAHAQTLLLQTIGSAVAVSSALVTLWMRSYTPLLGLLIAVILPTIGGAWLNRRQRRCCELEIAACRTEPEFSEEDLARVRAGLK